MCTAVYLSFVYLRLTLTGSSRLIGSLLKDSSRQKGVIVFFFSVTRACMGSGKFQRDNLNFNWLINKTEIN